MNSDSTDPRIGNVLVAQLGSVQASRVLSALGSDTRRAILQVLEDRTMNVSEVAEALGATVSATSEHIKTLASTGLIETEMTPGTRGLQKSCARAVDAVVIELPRPVDEDGRTIEVSMPVGAFTDFEVHPTCGLLGSDGAIGMLDDVRSFYEPGRVGAQLLWFHHGYVEYRFPDRLVGRDVATSLQLTMEVCSEAPLHDESWPSDITVSVNGVSLGVWTSPGDFGDKRGAFTPRWWSTANTQYGLMKLWQVTGEGSYVDGVRLSDTTLDDHALGREDFVSVRIAVSPEAENVGGVNVFGAGFGNYPQDIVLRIRCADAADRER